MKMPYLKKFAKDKFPTLFEKLRIIKKLVFKCLFQSPTKLMVNIGGGALLEKGLVGFGISIRMVSTSEYIY